MRLAVVGDVTFVIGWQRGYAVQGVKMIDPLTKVELPATPTTAFYKEQMPALDALIKTPIAFAILAPYGWAGERCWYEYDKMAQYGWNPVAWKESTHKDHTFVQFYVKKLDRPDLKTRPETGKILPAMYDQKWVDGSDLPNLGCSSILQSVDKKMAIFEPKYPVMYKQFDPEKCMHFVRVARPATVKTVAALKKNGFKRLLSLTYNSYWLKAKWGLGTKEACEY